MRHSALMSMDYMVSISLYCIIVWNELQYGLAITRCLVTQFYIRHAIAKVEPKNPTLNSQKTPHNSPSRVE